jgi:protein SCO1/2
MERIQYRTRNLREGFMLVSFTVDPKNDTPPVLSAYAREHHAAPHRWRFVTGEPAAVAALVTDGFKSPGGADHTGRLYLVDGKGRVRGLYDDTNEEEDRLIRDAGLLANFPVKDP